MGKKSKKREPSTTEPRISENAANEPLEPEPEPEPVYLSEVALELPPAAVLEEPRPRPVVPPSTPPSEFHFELTFQPIPRTDRNLTDLEIPIIRDKGLKQCIEEMSEFFQCADYKFNFLQFWFLDVLTDCIWRAQDQFEFPPEQQKIIMAWMLFIIDLIGDPKQNYSQQEFFDVFKEIILTAAEVLEEGSGEILLPLKLIQLPTDTGSEESKEASSPSAQSGPSTTTATSSQSQVKEKSTTEERDSMNYESVLEFEVGAEEVRVVLDHEKCNCSEFGESLFSSVERLLEEQTCCDSSKLKFPLSENENEEEIDNDWDYRDFYKPDKKIPSRFLPLTSSEQLQELLKKEEVDISLKDIGPKSKLTFLPIPRSEPRSGRSSDKLTDYVIFRKESWQKSYDATCYEDQSEIALTDENKDETLPVSQPGSKEESEKTQHERIMKGLRNFKLMEQRVRDFSDSKVGLDEWQMGSTKSGSKIESPLSGPEEEDKAKCFVDEKLEKLVDKETMQTLDEQEFLSFGVLWAIIDIVYEYFSDSFQYTLIKMALTIQPNLFIQKLNEEWRTPKGLIEDLTLYVKDLKDKHKMIQRKKEKIKKEKKKKDKKKDKKSKSDKSSKKKGKSDKKSKKSGKSKKDKKGKEKKVPLTEEELLLMRLLEEQEAERLRQEMNKKFLFPLQDAINDEFFMTKFANWEKVELTKGKGKKDKKDKKDNKKKK